MQQFLKLLKIFHPTTVSSMVCLAGRKERKGKGIMGEVEEREENDILESYFDSSKQKKNRFIAV